jgi:hypothetical protein
MPPQGTLRPGGQYLDGLPLPTATNLWTNQIDTADVHGEMRFWWQQPGLIYWHIHGEPCVSVDSQTLVCRAGGTAGVSGTSTATSTSATSPTSSSSPTSQPPTTPTARTSGSGHGGQPGFTFSWPDQWPSWVPQPSTLKTVGSLLGLGANIVIRGDGMIVAAGAAESSGELVILSTALSAGAHIAEALVPFEDGSSAEGGPPTPAATVPPTATETPTADDAEDFYRAMTEPYFRQVVANNGLLTPRNFPGEIFVSQDLDYVTSYMDRPGSVKQGITALVHYEMKAGTRDALIAAGARDANVQYPEERLMQLPVLTSKMRSVVHVKLERGAITFGLRADSIGIFNDNILSFQRLEAKG